MNKPLKLNGKMFRPDYSAAYERLEQFIDSLPDDDLFNQSGICAAGKFASDTVVRGMQKLIAQGKCYQAEKQTFYGNKKAIASLKALLAAPKP